MKITMYELYGKIYELFPDNLGFKIVKEELTKRMK